MAEILGVPYQQIVIAAIIPAFLYYAALFFQVDMEAAKNNLKGLPREQLPKISGVLGKGYLFVIPFFVLLIALFGFYLSPEKAALVGVLSILILGLVIQQKTQFRFGWILEALRQTSRALIAMVPMVVLAGIVIGTVSYTGMGFLISLNLSQLVGENLIFLLPVIAVTCFILGMGMPTLCAYILLAVLLGPVMVELGIIPIAAHLFILFYAIASMVTPPVCIAAYAAAAIADANPMLTGLVSARFAIIKYIIPFLFVFFPALLFFGSPWEIIAAFVTATLGCYMLSAGLSGYLFLHLNPLKRLISLAIGIGLLIPIQKNLTAISTVGNLLSGLLALSLIAWEWRRKKKQE
jgi:TRAP transporter 4TM/12TM fusion protein